MTTNPSFPQSTGSVVFGKADLHWKVKSAVAQDSSALSKAFVREEAPVKNPNKLNNNRVSAKWIDTGIITQGDYVYETKFDYPKVKGSVCRGTLSFGYAADDFVREIYLNGIQVYSCGAETCRNEDYFHTKEVSGSIKGSNNFLQFVVHKRDFVQFSPHEGALKISSEGFLFQFNELYVQLETCTKVHSISGLQISLIVNTILLCALPLIIAYVFYKFKRTRVKFKTSNHNCVIDNVHRFSSQSLKSSTLIQDSVPVYDSTQGYTRNVETTHSFTSFPDAFLHQLRKQGFKVDRHKDGRVRDQILKLNSNYELMWFDHFYSTIQTLRDLKKVYSDPLTGGFIMEFSTEKIVKFKLKKSEYPFTNQSMIFHFNVLLKQNQEEDGLVYGMHKIAYEGDSEDSNNNSIMSHTSDSQTYNSVVSSPVLNDSFQSTFSNPPPRLPSTPLHTARAAPTSRPAPTGGRRICKRSRSNPRTRVNDQLEYSNSNSRSRSQSIGRCAAGDIVVSPKSVIDLSFSNHIAQSPDTRASLSPRVIPNAKKLAQVEYAYDSPAKMRPSPLTVDSLYPPARRLVFRSPSPKKPYVASSLHAETLGSVNTSPDNNSKPRSIAMATNNPIEHFQDFLDNSAAMSLMTDDSSRVVQHDLVGHSNVVTKLRLVDSCSRIISSSHDGTVRIWSAEEECRQREICCMSVNAADDRASKSRAKVPYSQVVNIWADEECERVYAACSDFSVYLMNASTGENERVMAGHTAAITAIEGFASQDSFGSEYLVVTASADKTARVWDRRSQRQQVQLMRGHTDAVTCVSFAENGRVLVTGSKDKTLRIWDIRAGRHRQTLDKHYGAVTNIQAIPESVRASKAAQSPGKVAVENISGLISCGRDPQINCWSKTWDCMASLTAHRGYVTSISKFATLSRGHITHDTAAPGPSILLSCGQDNLIKVWDMNRLKFSTEINTDGKSQLHKAAWFGDRIVSTYANGDVKMHTYTATFNTSPNAQQESAAINISLSSTVFGEWCCSELGRHHSACTDLVSAGQTAVVASKDGKIILWNNI